MRLCLLAVLLTVWSGLGLTSVHAQAPGGPPSVGVVRVQKQPITETSEFVGRIQATDRVNLIARVTAFLEERHFTEGTEVKQGDLLYVLEQPPFQADLEAKKAAVQQMQATLQNAEITLNRASSLLHTPAGQQSTVDDARALMLSDAAQVLAAQAQQRQSEINLGYTEIHAPISGKIGRTTVTIGNVVSPEFRHAGDHRQPGSDVCGVSGRGARDAGTAAPLCRQGRLPRGGHQGPPAGRNPVSAEGNARFRRQHRCRHHRHRHPARLDRQPGARIPRQAASPSANWSMASSSPCCWRVSSRWSCWRCRAPRCCPTSRATTSIPSMPATRCSRRACSSASRPDDGRRAERSDRGPDGRARRHPAGAPRPGGDARAGQPARLDRDSVAVKPMISAVFIAGRGWRSSSPSSSRSPALLSMLRIPVAQFPDIVPPQVTVTATYPGASAQAVESYRRPADRGAGRRRRQDAST